MSFNKRHLRKLDWFIYREEQEKRFHHPAEHNPVVNFSQEPEGTGQKTLDRLIDQLCDTNANVRFEVVRALEQFDETLVMGALVKKTQDCNLSVRWAAMNILIQVGRKGLRPLFEALTQDFNSYCLRQSARHILQTLYERGDLTSHEVDVLRALEKRTPAAHIASMANNALIESL